MWSCPVFIGIISHPIEASLAAAGTLLGVIITRPVSRIARSQSRRCQVRDAAIESKRSQGPSGGLQQAYLVRRLRKACEMICSIRGLLCSVRGLERICLESHIH